MTTTMKEAQLTTTIMAPDNHNHEINMTNNNNDHPK